VPIYEFRCNSCRKRTSVFARSMTSPVAAVCEHCASPEVSRIFSRVAVLRGGDDFSGLDESGMGDVDENDPRSVARWVRKMSREMGEPLAPEMEGDLERMEAGEAPDDALGGGEDSFADLD
jgi:putative FmdB family regulatory protein